MYIPISFITNERSSHLLVLTLCMSTNDADYTPQPRENWEEAFIKAGSLTDQSEVMPTISNNFDEQEWTW